MRSISQIEIDINDVDLKIRKLEMEKLQLQEEMGQTVVAEKGFVSGTHIVYKNGDVVRYGVVTGSQIRTYYDSDEFEFGFKFTCIKKGKLAKQTEVVYSYDFRYVKIISEKEAYEGSNGKIQS